jgi:hypothetical protein
MVEKCDILGCFRMERPSMYLYCKTYCNFNQVKANMPYLNSLKSFKSHTLIRLISIRGADFTPKFKKKTLFYVFWLLISKKHVLEGKNPSVTCRRRSRRHFYSATCLDYKTHGAEAVSIGPTWCPAYSEFLNFLG